MKPLSEQNHYEILETPRDATREEIERAYRLAQATYSDDSLAGYSVFGDGDVNAMRERIELAYRVLSDAQSRRAYDAGLSQEELFVAPPASAPPAPPREAPAAAAEPPRPPPPEPRRLRPQLDAFEDLEEESDEFDGGRLRRSRLRRGVELDEISRITKISPAYLQFLEDERFADLPAPVYVRGFVSAYASCVGLDPKRVATSYMRRYESECADPHGRFRGRAQP